jgi:hypothetical protein
MRGSPPLRTEGLDSRPDTLYGLYQAADPRDTEGAKIRRATDSVEVIFTEKDGQKTTRPARGQSGRRLWLQPDGTGNFLDLHYSTISQILARTTGRAKVKTLSRTLLSLRSFCVAVTSRRPWESRRLPRPSLSAPATCDRCENRSAKLFFLLAIWRSRRQRRYLT